MNMFDYDFHPRYTLPPQFRQWSDGTPVNPYRPFRTVWTATLLHGFYVTNLDIKHEKAAAENKPAA